MKNFRNGQRVLVKYVEEDGILITPTFGTVVRLRMKDDGAWVTLERRIDGACPFPANDLRGRDVLTFPEFCEKASNRSDSGGEQ